MEDHVRLSCADVPFDIRRSEPAGTVGRRTDGLFSHTPRRPEISRALSEGMKSVAALTRHVQRRVFILTLYPHGIGLSNSRRNPIDAI